MNSPCTRCNWGISGSPTLTGYDQIAKGTTQATTSGSAVGFTSIPSWVKKITFQKVTQAGLLSLAPIVACMARAEGLEAHAQAVLIREEVSRG